ncbi:MAG: alpha/beta hydrolase [Casimicrobiaceae bacterium]
MLDAITLEPPSPATAAILWMHGLGADAHDFVPIVPELGLPADHAIRFVFPNAPIKPVTINGGQLMRAWYDIVSPDLERRVDEQGVRASQREIEALIEAQVSRGIASDRILLAGFSQGGVIALQTGLRHGSPLAGVIALSTYLACADSLGAEAAPQNREIPIFMAHGTFDPVVPLALGRLSRARLETHGYRVEWHEYGMPHSVCAEEIADLGAFVRRVLI